uniref:DM2 domain-containing protein n=1 Tax=viral metagenome TaxID=1070528 RepID=A0A6C0AQW8_9ZZZZ
MPKKPSTKTVETEQVVAAPAPIVDKKAKKPKAVKPVVDVAAPVPLVEQSADVTATVTAATAAEISLAEQTVEFQSKLHQIGVLLSALKSEFRCLEKKWTRDVKIAQKQSSKRKRKAGNRAPSGFVKPTKISDELASFLGKEKGTEMARTDVTREINAYIRANKLQDQDNGRKIIPDTKLATLLKLKKSDELTYFNLQKYMSPHFAKAVKDAVAAAVVV